LKEKKIVWWLPTAAYMMLIFYLSSKTGDEVSIPTPDYVAHGVEYFGLGLLLAVSLKRTTGLSSGRVAVLAVIIASLYGISDEWHQSFVPGRFATVSDWLADTVGAALGQVGYTLFKKKI